jgi:ribosomal protein L12E/L44/L45/RPP1/RPP2
MGNISPISRLAKKNGIELITHPDLGTTTAKINGHEFTGDTPKAALGAAIKSLRDADVASMTPIAVVDNGVPIVAKAPKKRKTKKAAAPKKKKRARTREEDEEEAEEEAEEGQSEEVVRRKYRMKYAETDNHCNDALAVAFHDATQVSTGVLPIVAIKQIAAANGVDLKRWEKHNPGMIRMNLGNVLRGKLRRGETVHVGKQTFKPEKSNGKSNV